MTTFIGRKSELTTLEALRQKKSGSLVVVKGRRRIGKSRLVEEFAKRSSFELLMSFRALLQPKKLQLNLKEILLLPSLGPY